MKHVGYQICDRIKTRPNRVFSRATPYDTTIVSQQNSIIKGQIVRPNYCARFGHLFYSARALHNYTQAHSLTQNCWRHACSTNSNNGPSECATFETKKLIVVQGIPILLCYKNLGPLFGFVLQEWHQPKWTCMSRSHAYGHVHEEPEGLNTSHCLSRHCPFRLPLPTKQYIFNWRQKINWNDIIRSYSRSLFQMLEFNVVYFGIT